MAMPAHTASPAYVLSASEIASLRTQVGKATSIVGWGESSAALKRVFQHVTGKHGGLYTGKPRSALEVFWEHSRGPPDEIELRDGRYISGGACMMWACHYNKTAYLVDTVTGHVAMAFTHWHDVEGQELPYSGLAIFTKSCASAEFKAYAYRYFDAWARRSNASVTTLTTRC